MTLLSIKIITQAGQFLLRRFFENEVTILTIINYILASLFIPIFLAALAYMLCVGIMSKAVLTRTPQYEKKSKFNKVCIAVSAGVSFLFVLKFGFTFELLKATLILAVFLFASVCDIKERKVEDYVQIMLLLIGLINVSPSILFSRAMAFAISFVLMFVIAVISNIKIGGADVKFIPACIFVLGAGRGVFGLVTGLLIAVIGTLIRNKIKKSEEKTLPLIPYLSAGFLIGYLI